MDPEARQLPLFPLTATLMPGGTLPLHIFEPRYRAMLRDCRAADERFGVLLIAEGVEVGGPAVPHATGTVARIALLEELADGRATLMAVGERRFRLEEHWLAPAGYLVGRVRLLPEVMDAAPERLDELMAGMRAILGAYIERLSPEAERLRAELAVMGDPLQLVGLGASLLPGAQEEKQRLLELDSVPARLEGIRALLRRELALLDVLARPTQATLRRDTISPN